MIFSGMIRIDVASTNAVADAEADRRQWRLRRGEHRLQRRRHHRRRSPQRRKSLGRQFQLFRLRQRQQAQRRGLRHAPSDAAGDQRRRRRRQGRRRSGDAGDAGRRRRSGSAGRGSDADGRVEIFGDADGDDSDSNADAHSAGVGVCVGARHSDGRGSDGAVDYAPDATAAVDASARMAAVHLSWTELLCADAGWSYSTQLQSTATTAAE